MTAVIETIATIPSSALRALLETREFPLLLLIVLVIVVMSVVSPHFLSPANFRAVAIGMTPTAIIVIGMALLLASGGFDLSAGAVLALSTTVIGLLLVGGAPIWLAVSTALSLGVTIELGNGALVTLLGIDPLVATSGTMSIARGVALVLTEGFSVSSLSRDFGYVGSGAL